MYILLSPGMFAEMERLGTNLNDIDTTDCDYSLESLQVFIINRRLVVIKRQGLKGFVPWNLIKIFYFTAISKKNCFG